MQQPTISALVSEAEGAFATAQRAFDALAEKFVSAQINAALTGNPRATAEMAHARAAIARVSAGLNALTLGAPQSPADDEPDAAVNSRPPGLGPPAWGVSAEPTSCAPTSCPSALPTKPISQHTPTSGAKLMQYDFGDGIRVPVMVLPPTCTQRGDVLRAIRGPMLCYVPAWGHFAIRVGDALLHAGVGRVFPAGTKHPEGVKACKNLDALCRRLDEGGALPAQCATQCAPTCAYYHDPVKLARLQHAGLQHAGSGGLRVRNYMDTSFMYVARHRPGARASSPRGARYGLRHYGNVDTLALDLATLSTEDAERYLDQVAHDVICAAILAYNHAGLAVKARLTDAAR